MTTHAPTLPALAAARTREKRFTDGRQRPIDRNDRARLLFLAKAARRRGELTRAAVEIFEALLYRFANLRDGRCFPSYARLADAAGCAARTVGRCLPGLERLGLIAWIHRLRRLREPVAGLPGVGATDWRVVRTSNAYRFPLARLAPDFATKGHSVLGTGIPELFSIRAKDGDRFGHVDKPRGPLDEKLDSVLARSRAAAVKAS
jgi:hypothetical protein